MEKSFCDHLRHDHPDATGTASWFISHAWQYPFLDLVDAVTTFFSELDALETFIFLDLLSLPQHHRTETITAQWLSDFFTNAIFTMKNILAIWSPWNKPITLTRAWCVYELYTGSINDNVNLRIAMPPGEALAFRDSIATDPGVFYGTISSIKSDQTTATKAEDLAAVRKAITETVGFEALDRIVLSFLSDWMVSNLTSHVALTKKEGRLDEHARWLHSLGRLYIDRKMHTDAEPCLVECWEARRDKLGSDHPETLATVNQLATVYLLQGKSRDAVQLLVEWVDRAKKTLGDDHLTTIALLSNMAELYEQTGQWKLIEPIRKECVDRAERLMGGNHVDVIGYLHQLGLFYKRQQRFHDAEHLYKQCVDRRQRLLGVDHPEALSSLYELALLYRDFGQYAKAEVLCVECVDRRRRVLGDEHPDTVLSIEALTFLYEAQRKTAEAEKLHRDVLGRAKWVLGAAHPTTIHSTIRLAQFYASRQKYAEAEPLYVESLATARDLFGEKHSATSISLDGLCALYERTNRFEEAVNLCEDRLDRIKKVYGDGHPETLKSYEALSELYGRRRDFDNAELWMLKYWDGATRQPLGDHPSIVHFTSQLMDWYQGPNHSYLKFRSHLEDQSNPQTPAYEISCIKKRLGTVCRQQLKTAIRRGDRSSERILLGCLRELVGLSDEERKRVRIVFQNEPRHLGPPMAPGGIRSDDMVWGNTFGWMDMDMEDVLAVSSDSDSSLSPFSSTYEVPLVKNTQTITASGIKWEEDVRLSLGAESSSDFTMLDQLFLALGVDNKNESDQAGISVLDREGLVDLMPTANSDLEGSEGRIGSCEQAERIHISNARPRSPLDPPTNSVAQEETTSNLLDVTKTSSTCKKRSFLQQLPLPISLFRHHKWLA
ncbi:Kinesin light chain 3 [Rhizophlyctis rosea]|nr:Kinesin light chain 3 [Rhizophlyctis rosea]